MQQMTTGRIRTRVAAVRTANIVRALPGEPPGHIECFLFDPMRSGPLHAFWCTLFTHIVLHCDTVVVNVPSTDGPCGNQTPNHVTDNATHRML